MGFYLWVGDGLDWAQGTYEYRPMGTAVISASDLFRRRDFDPRRKVRSPARSAQFLGQFASLGDMNAQLQKRRSCAPQFHVGNLARRRQHVQPGVCR